MLRLLTAGESHNRGTLVVLDGFPAGLHVDEKYINDKLSQRQKGYGRGGRMKIEHDTVDFLSGVFQGKTIGSPISLMIWNKDYANWEKQYKAKHDEESIVAIPRPGHADLSGYLKYGFDSIRPVIERASARSTAAFVAAGALCMTLLRGFGADSVFHTIQIGSRKIAKDFSFSQIKELAGNNDINCCEEAAADDMRRLIDRAKGEGNTLGGAVEVRVRDIVAGLGSYAQWDGRLDSAIAQAVMAIPSVKAVEIGNALSASGLSGREVQDEIFRAQNGYARRSNNCGGIEGGISTGGEIVVRAYFKPIPTLKNPLPSVDVRTKKAVEARFERSDVCAVPSAGVIVEMQTIFVLTRFFLEKFGCDSIAEIKRNFDAYKSYLAGR